MDTSYEYIVMCNKAVELQDLYKDKIVDEEVWKEKVDRSNYVIAQYQKFVPNNVKSIGRWIEQYDPNPDAEHWFDLRRNFVWLPRLDQLFRLCTQQPDKPWFFAASLNNFMNRDYNHLSNKDFFEKGEDAIIRYKTIEQVCLGLYMNKCHNKEWDLNTNSWIFIFQ